MSILIKDMEMPKTKECLVVAITDNGAFVMSETDGQIDYETIEIPDGHGRLIDAEPIMKFITDGLNSGEFGYDQIKVLTEIQYAPTVIPSDKGGET